MYLMLENTMWSDDFVEEMLRHVRVDGAERVVKQERVGVLVDGTRQRHALLLTTRQVDALANAHNTVLRHSLSADDDVITV